MLVNLKQKSQVTIPKPLVDKLKLRPGDKLEFTLEDDKIIIKPVLVIDRSQAWYWSREWQAGEREVDRQIKEGKTYAADGEEELFKGLGLDKV